MAEMTYVILNQNRIDINHTEVDEALKGKGIGYKLVNAAVIYLRDNNLKASASCPYVQYVFSKKQNEYEDIIQKNN